MKAVYKRELRSYFNSMIGYVFVAVVLIFIGIYFLVINLNMGYPYFAYTLSNTLIIFVFVVPILTMRSMAEERRSKTDQLLLTYPVSATSVVLGKFFAMMTVFAIPLLISCLCPIVIITGGAGSFLIDYAAIFAFLCLGCMFVSVGMFISALTESQIIAAVATMALLLLMYLWSALIGLIPSTAAASLIGLIIILAAIVLLLWSLTKSRVVSGIAALAGAAALAITYIVNSSLFEGLLQKLLGVFSVVNTISNFTSYYVFDAAGILLFLSVSAMFIFLTVQTLQKRRWS